LEHDSDPETQDREIFQLRELAPLPSSMLLLLRKVSKNKNEKLACV